MTRISTILVAEKLAEEQKNTSIKEYFDEIN